MNKLVTTTRHAAVFVVTINRPAKRNAVDGETAHALYHAFKTFDADDDLAVAILTGAGTNFCAGADLQAMSDEARRNPLNIDGDLGPMGVTRLRLSKPVIAAIEGYAVAGGMELALWCDLRVASGSAIFGIFCRRVGVPLVDLGTIRLPRLIGESRAMDLILSGREVDADEAERMGLVNRLAPAGQALRVALELGAVLASMPQTCLRNDRLSVKEQWGLAEADAIRNEMERGLATIGSGETERGAKAFMKARVRPEREG